MAMRAVVTYRNEAAVRRSDLHKAVKAALLSVGESWFETFMPLHFQYAAFGRYGYKPRQVRNARGGPGYEIRKRRKVGHGRPLVYTGRLEREVKQRMKVASTFRGARVVLTGPQYLHQNRHGKQPDKAAELIVTTQWEAECLARNFEKALTLELKGVRRVVRKRV